MEIARHHFGQGRQIMGHLDEGRTRSSQVRAAVPMTEYETQRCIVCGRRFIKRAEPICSRDCAEKARDQSCEKRG